MLSDFFATQMKRISRFPNYVRAFGPITGIRLLLGIERSLPSRSEIVRAYRTPGYRGAVHLRECVSDHSIYWQCLVQRQYDLSGFVQTAKLMEQYRSIISRNACPVILDAGGNIGLAAIWFAQSFPEAAVVTVEPDEGNFGILQRNLVQEERIHAVHGAVTQRAMRVRIVNRDAGPSSFQIGRSDNSTESGIEGYTVDALSACVEGGELFIAKIDIEGGQRFLFSENTEWLDRVHLIIIELDDWQFPWKSTSQHFFCALSRRRFDYLIRGESLFCFRHIDR